MLPPAGFAGLAALIELPLHAAPVSIRTTFGFLLKTIGQAKDTPRSALGDRISAASAVSLLQLLSANLPEVHQCQLGLAHHHFRWAAVSCSCLLLLPQDVSLHDAAAALCADAEVSLDALIGLSCLLSTGSNKDKLQLCFWTLDR